MYTGLTSGQIQFLNKRASRVKAWRWVSKLLAIVIVVLAIWLIAGHPLLANPFVATTRLAAGDIESETLTVMAAMLPVVTVALLLLTAALIAFTHVAMSNERKHMIIIERLRQSLADSKE